jgi:hypothetical protein
MQKLTPWFDGKLYKPVYPGVYQQLNGDKQLGYQRWDGRLWYAWYESVERAAKSIGPAARGFQNDNWRGLAKDPTKQ